MPPRFEGKFGIPGSHETGSQLTSALYKLYRKSYIDVNGVERTEGVTPEDVENEYTQIINELIIHGRSLSAKQKQVLHLKLARHFEKNLELESRKSIIDALLETPRFLDSDEGDFRKLLDIHHMKTLQKIAENRKELAKRVGNAVLNPYENLFETSSGNFYMARLINKAHLVQESDDLKHCVGTSDSYFMGVVRGDIDIFSFRDKSTDQPLFTIEYDRKHKTIVQVSGERDLPQAWDENDELLEALELLSGTFDERGERRVFDTTFITGLKLLKKMEREGTDERLTTSDLALLYELYAAPKKYLLRNDGERAAKLIKQRNIRDDIARIHAYDISLVATKTSEYTLDTQYYFKDPGLVPPL